MKLINSVGPYRHVVRMFMAERGISVPLEEIDIMKGKNREGDYLKTNPAGQSPTLVLEDGSVITEITRDLRISRREVSRRQPDRRDAEERAQTRRWTRWVDLNIVEPLVNGFRFSEGLPMFQSRFRCLPEARAGLKAKAQDGLAFMDAPACHAHICRGREVHARGCAAVLLPRLRRRGRPAAQSGDEECRALVCGRWRARRARRPRFYSADGAPAVPAPVARPGGPPRTDGSRGSVR